MPVPSYPSVPEHWKNPFGPYRQAPAEFGGNWWYVSPFTGTEPWLTQGGQVELPSYPAGFIDAFPKPSAKEFPKFGVSYQQAMSRWYDDLKYFKRAGLPEGFDTKAWDAARRLFIAWDMGEPMPFAGRYGFAVRFPNSLIPWFETSIMAAVEAAHHVIARYQISLRSAEVDVNKKHPFVPPDFFPEESE